MAAQCKMPIHDNDFTDPWQNEKNKNNEIPSIPLPLDPSPPQEADDKRLWIGNLDSRLTEYHLIKVLQKFGTVKKFDFLFHKSGPLKGQPRGYCFVTYETRSEAEKALAALNGKTVLSKNLSVKWANSVPAEENYIRKPQLVLPGMNLQQEKSNKSIKSQINAIEAKLRSMEHEREIELERCLTATAAKSIGNKLSKTNKLNLNRSKPYPERKVQVLNNR